MKSLAIIALFGALSTQEASAVQLGQFSQISILGDGPAAAAPQGEATEAQQKAGAIAQEAANVEKENARKAKLTKKELKAEEQAKQAAINQVQAAAEQQLKQQEKAEKQAEKQKKKEKEAKEAAEFEKRQPKIVTVDGNSWTAALPDHHFPSTRGPLNYSNVSLAQTEKDNRQRVKEFKSLSDLIEDANRKVYKKNKSNKSKTSKSKKDAEEQEETNQDEDD